MIQLYCMGSYVTTNIRIPEEDYLRLKAEAAKKRTSLSSVIREKIRPQQKKESPEVIMRRLKKYASEDRKYVEGVDIVRVLRGMRDGAKW